MYSWKSSSGNANFRGVPDLVVEILSPATSRLDQHIKFGAYEQAGVPEYWLVDPKARAVTVFTLDPETAKYTELGRSIPGETARSRILPGLELPVEPLFPARPSE